MGHKKLSYFSFLHTALCLALNSIVFYSCIAYITDVLHADDFTIKNYFFDYLVLSFFWPMILTCFVFILSFITLMFGILQDATCLKFPAKAEGFGIAYNRLSMLSTLFTLLSVVCSYGFKFYHLSYLEWTGTHIVEMQTGNQELGIIKNLGFIDWKSSILLVVIVLTLSIALVGISIVNRNISAKMRRGGES